jgi:hypothetical protein
MFTVYTYKYVVLVNPMLARTKCFVLCQASIVLLITIYTHIHTIAHAKLRSAVPEAETLIHISIYAWCGPEALTNMHTHILMCVLIYFFGGEGCTNGGSNMRVNNAY